jgi:HTH-type transcriptional regulator, glycine betaine synthesis regulator
MDEPAVVPDPESPQSLSGADELIKRFVEHWGMMARAWGINPSMGELFALLYISGTDWTAEDLRQWLQVSRGNVSMNLRELMSWGVVRKVHRPGERRELFRAETEVWTLFRRIVTERKRRELDPTLTVLDRIFQLSEVEPKLADLRSRVESLRQFFRLIDALVVRLLALNSGDLDELTQFLSAVNLDHLRVESPEERP